MPSTPRSKPKPPFKLIRVKARSPSKPLRQDRQEIFAKVFADTLNPGQAVQSAGYTSASPARIAGRLLALPAMQSRIRYLQQKDAAALDGVKLVQSLYLHPKEMIAKAACRNPFSGEFTLDLARLTPRELSTFDFKLSSNNGQFGTGVAVSLHSNAAGTLAALERIISNPNYAPDRQGNISLTKTLKELAQRNASAAPLRELYDDDEKH